MSKLQAQVDRLAKRLETIQGQDVESRKLTKFMAGCTDDELRVMANCPEGERLPVEIQKKLEQAGVLP